jgi:hypothetical protein
MRKIYFLAVAALLYFCWACEHAPTGQKPCIAGSGGEATLTAYAVYNSNYIPNYYTHQDTAYVKYGTLLSPGTQPEDYDTYYLSEAGEDHIHCSGLKCGDYFIYRTAWDSVAGVSRYGGAAISLSETGGEHMCIVVVN